MIHAILKNTPYQTEFTNSRITSMADVAEDKGGQGAGFRPHDLLEAAMAICFAMTARMYAEKKGVVPGEIRVHVNLERTDNESVFHYKLDVAEDISEELKTGMNEAIQRCPVHRTLMRKISLHELTQ